MILASQFESLVHPLTILLSLPLSVPFALLSLWATGNTLNLYSALGHAGAVRRGEEERDPADRPHEQPARAGHGPRCAAIMQGNRDRLRPILMTTLALVAGMLPLALGTGPGAEERRAIAVVVIGGQTLSLLLTLLVTPVAYSLFDDLRGKEHVGALVRRFWPKAKRESLWRRRLRSRSRATRVQSPRPPVSRADGEDLVPLKLPIDHDWIAGFCRRWRIQELALFGSVLRNDFRPDSDVDVLVTFEPNAPWTLWDLSRMRFELEELFGRKVDLVEKKALRNPFRRQAILADQQVVYAA